VANETTRTPSFVGFKRRSGALTDHTYLGGSCSPKRVINKARRLIEYTALHAAVCGRLWLQSGVVRLSPAPHQTSVQSYLPTVTNRKNKLFFSKKNNPKFFLLFSTRGEKGCAFRHGATLEDGFKRCQNLKAIHNLIGLGGAGRGRELQKRRGPRLPCVARR
jgi:hypothetical protein